MDCNYILDFALRYISFIVISCLLWGYYFYLHFTKQIKRSASIRKYAFIVCLSFVALACAEQVDWSIELKEAWMSSLIGSVFLLFPIMDWYTTKKALSNGAREANPVMDIVIKKFGMDKILFITVPVVGYVVMDLLSGGITATFIVFAFIYAFVVVNNLIVVRKQRG